MKKIEERDFDYVEIVRTSSYAFLGLILILVLVFVGAGKFHEQKGITVIRPDGGCGESSPKITVKIDKNGGALIDGKSISDHQLRILINKKLENLNRTDEIALMIHADQESKMKDFTRIHDLLKTIEDERISIIFK